MSSDNDTLVLIHAISRHGDRTPDTRAGYPNDPHRLNEYYPYGPGMLTNEGKKTMYGVGKAFRERYNNFLGELYIPSNLEAWTTEPQRNRNSAQLFLAALFPPRGILKWNKELNWQPIHVNYTPMISDELLSPVVTMQKFISTYRQTLKSEYGKKILDKYQDLISYVEKHTGKVCPSTRELALLYDCFRTQEEFGLTLPEWSNAVYPDPLRQTIYDEFKLQTCTKELQKYTCGQLFKKILTDTQKKINEQSECKLHYYQAHDINIANIFGTLGLFKDLPKYGAALIFEVHRINGRYGIKLIYREGPNGNFESKKLIDGQIIWWMEDFEKFVNDLCSDVEK